MLLDLMLSLLVISLCANAFQAILYLKSIKNPKPQVQRTEDALEILRDLATGPALIKVEYVDRSEIFLRSPRDQR